jgi:F-box-like
MLKSPRKWGTPSAEEVQSIRERIHQVETKLLEYPADGTIEELMLELMLYKGYIAPIRKLPFEILSEIFILCSLSSGRSTPVRISAVCHQWRQTMLASPLAWTRISPYTDGPRSSAQLLAYVTTFLQRSRLCMLHLDWSLHPYNCIRNYNRRQQSSNPWEQHCHCDIMKKIAEHSDRIQCLQTDRRRMDTFIKMDLPNVKRLASYDWTSTLLLHLAKFPNLSYLDLREYRGTFGVQKIPQTRLRHLSIRIDMHEVWSQMINRNERTLKTLRLTSDFSNPRDLQRNILLECPVLERVMVEDRSIDTGTHLASNMMFIIRLTAPNLKFYQYLSRHQLLQLAHDTDFNKVGQLRTDFESPLSHYRHLRVLQLFYSPELILNILDQLEGNYELCPELSVIEVCDGLSSTSTWTVNHGDTIHHRIAVRNTKANSHIKLLLRPHCNRWEHSVPDDDEVVRLAASLTYGLTTSSVRT